MTDAKVLAVIAAGGACGSLTRYGIGVAFAHQPDQFPTATLAINVSGCLLIGVLMTLLTRATAPHRLLRPFVGIGFLGGYTTFSTYAVDILTLLRTQQPALALAYLAVTLIGALAAVYLGAATTRWVLDRRRA